MKVHELKTWPLPFQAMVDGIKTFEIRENDRGFKVGDALYLREWNPDTREYTGRSLKMKVTYLTSEIRFGVAPGYVVMSVVPL